MYSLISPAINKRSYTAYSHQVVYVDLQTGILKQLIPMNTLIMVFHSRFQFMDMNTVHIPCPLWGKPQRQPSKGPVIRNVDVLFEISMRKLLTNSPCVGDLRSNCSHETSIKWAHSRDSLPSYAADGPVDTLLSRPHYGNTLYTVHSNQSPARQWIYPWENNSTWNMNTLGPFTNPRPPTFNYPNITSHPSTVVNSHIMHFCKFSETSNHFS